MRNEADHPEILDTTKQIETQSREFSEQYAKLVRNGANPELFGKLFDRMGAIFTPDPERAKGFSNLLKTAQSIIAPELKLRNHFN